MVKGATPIRGKCDPSLGLSSQEKKLAVIDQLLCQTLCLQYLSEFSS